MRSCRRRSSARSRSFAYVIHKLSELDGARWWVTADGVLKYMPFGTYDGLYTVFINQTTQPIVSDCLHLRVHHDLQSGKDQTVNIRAWHPRKKKAYGYKARVPGRGGAIDHQYNIPTLLQDQVEKQAKSLATERARHELMVRATVVGDPSVAAGMGLSVSGTLYFDQTYDIDTVHHEFGMRGHTTHITARSAKQGRVAS